MGALCSITPKTPQATYKLYYFDTQGRGEQTRALLRYYNIKFEDIRVRADQWPNMKYSPKFEYAQLPMLETKGLCICQSYAIMYYLGREFKCIPTDVMEEYEMNNVICAVNDLLNTVNDISFNSKSAQDRAKRFGEFYDKTFPFIVSKIEDRLKDKSDKSHIVGENISLADFSLIGLAIGLYSSNDGSMVKKMIDEKFPILANYFEGLLKMV